MINVNKMGSKQLITKEFILKELDDYTIFRHYCGEFEIHRAFISPLRKENSPSFGIFLGENNELCFNDFKLGGGDFVKLVELLFGLTYFEALSKIAYDFNLENDYACKPLRINKGKKEIKRYDKEEALSKVSKFRLGKKARSWKIADFKFWKQFGITYVTLKKFNVQPVEYLFINDKIISTDKYAYCFIEQKDNAETYKIYQPLNKDFKWINNHNDSVWQGWTQLPKTGETLIITKSLKDVMSIYECTGIPAISLQAENVKPKEKIIEELKSRFENIYILYDNDFDSEVNWGRQFSTKLAAKLNLPRIEIKSILNSKDFSDLVKNHGTKVAKQQLRNLMWAHEAPF
tara:strand:- start:13777 stop:14814 length:1038 start_codon:yes stop_codon:yes gene_type:complete